MRKKREAPPIPGLTNLPPAPEPKPRKRRRILRLKALALLLVLVGVTVVGVHFLHGFQVQRSADSLIVQADKAEAEGDIAKTSNYLGRYIGFYPHDTDVLARFALLLKDQAQDVNAKLRAFYALERVLRQDRNRNDIRRTAMNLALEIGLFPDAKEHLEILLKDSPRDAANLYHLLGNAEQGLTKFKEAAKRYQKAIDLDPHQVKSYEALAYLLRNRLKKPKEADQVIQDMMGANPDSSGAQMVDIRYQRDFSKDLLSLTKEEQNKLEQRLAGLAEEDPDALLLSAEFHEKWNDPGKARASLEEGLKRYPEEVRFYHALARLHLGEGHKKEAVDLLRKCTEYLKEDSYLRWQTADLLILAGDVDHARKVMDKIKRNEITAGLLDYLDGRILLQQKDWGKAIPLLTRAEKKLLRFPDLHKRANLDLATCYRELGNPDGQLAACEAALELDPSWLPALSAKASALAALGQATEARNLFAGLSERESSFRVTTAQMRLVENLRLPPEQRRWGPVEFLLDGAPPGEKEALPWQLLRARVHALQGQTEEAQKFLEQARDKHPEAVEPWLALAGLHLRKEPQRSLALLADGEKALGQRLEFKLSQLRVLQFLKRTEEARKLQEQWDSEAGDLPDDQHAAWLRGLATTQLLQGETQAAEKTLNRLVKLEPKEFRPRVFLFELYVRSERFDEARKLLEEIQKVEGPEGTFWRYGQAVLLLGKPSPTEEEIEQAQAYLNEVRKRRPTWPPVLALEGHMAGLQGKPITATRKYQQAVDQGSRNPFVFRRLAALLNAQGRYVEAQSAIQKLLGQQGFLSKDMSKLEVDALLGQKTELDDRLLALAQKAIPEDSGDASDHLWLGQKSWMAGKKQEAEENFRKALALDEKNPAAWVILVSFLNNSGDKEKAKQEIEQARKKLPAENAPLTLAACYEVVGDKDRAKEAYQDALAKKPDDPAVLRAVSVYYLRVGEDAEAIRLLKQLMARKGSDQEEQVLWARRTLALTLMRTGDYQKSLQALRLLEQNLKARPESIADQRLRALILASHPSNRLAAIRSLEESFRSVPPSPIETFLLARLYYATGNWDEARRHMGDLLRTEEPDPVYLAIYIRWLLLNDEKEEAKVWLHSLKEREPNSLRTVASEARVLHADGEEERAVEILTTFARADSEDRRQRQLAVGLLLDELGHPNEAEPFLRAYAQGQEEKDPASVFPLVRHLARHNRLSDALSICNQVKDRVSPEDLARESINALRAGNPEAHHIAQVEGWLKEKQEKQPTSALLALAMANLRDLEGKREEATAIYQSLLHTDTGNLVAYNNLAVLLAMRTDQKDQALGYINKAIDIGGPLPWLLDSRAMIYLERGQGEKAIQDLRDALAAAPEPASYYRLARAYAMTNNLTEARNAWRKAQGAGLQENDLYILERPEYRELKTKLGDRR